MLDNRELTSVSLLGFLAIAVVVAMGRQGRGSLRENIQGMLRSFASRKLLMLGALYVGGIAASWFVARRIGLWRPGLWKPFGVWCATTGLALLRHVRATGTQKRLWKQAASTVPIPALLSYIADFEPFPLWVEVPGQIMVFCLAVALVAREAGVNRTGDGRLASTCLIAWGLAAAGWGLGHLIANWSNHDHGLVWREFLMPAWLTPAALLMIYVLSVIVAVELLAVRVSLFADDNRWKQKLAVALRIGGRPSRIDPLIPWGHVIGRTDGFREAWRETKWVEERIRQDAAADQAEQQRLAENTGVEGTDAEGQQLDRREFQETRDLLRQLAFNQMGHYNKNGRYGKGPAATFDHFARQHGLPMPAGIALHVTADGQGWYAERQTITGHWFAIGANAGTPDQWLYDGDGPPTSFPCEEEWDQWAPDSNSPNWD